MSQLNPDLPPYWFVSTPRQSGKSLYQRMLDSSEREKMLENEYKWIAWDLAKPGSDQTVIYPICPLPDPKWTEGFHPVAAPCPIAEAAFPKQSEADRIWDLIVLAAESSRYG